MTYPWLQNKEFLKSLDLLPVKTQYLKLTLLDWDENPIGELEGRATAGSININGSSAVRRSGSLTLVGDQSFYKVLPRDPKDAKKMLINKRVKVEVGYKNTTSHYRNHDIIWFPQGIFVIGSASVNNSTSGVTLNVGLKDKMALLNGEISGTLSIAMIHSPIDVVLENGETSREPVFFRDIIKTLVHEYGHIPLNKIYIDINGTKAWAHEDAEIVDRIQQTVRWVGAYPVYLEILDTQGEGENQFTINLLTTSGDNPNRYEYGENIGYINTDFVYPTEAELSSNAGESITSVLDKVKGALGNYEYFFDLDGNFIFQEIQNYINEGSPEENLEAAIAGSGRDYLVKNTDKSVYDFDDNVLVTALANNPQYTALKNDISVWGQRGDNKLAIHYHLIIDDKPKETESKTWTGYIKDDGLGTKRVYKSSSEGAEYHIWSTPIDWRMRLYLDYVLEDKVDENYPYGKELANSWPKIYDVKNHCFFAELLGDDIHGVKTILNNMPYFLDVINPVDDDGNEVLGHLKVSTIGRREKVLNDNQINCLFNPTHPNVVYIKSGQGAETEQMRQEAITNNQTFAQIAPHLYDQLSMGSMLNSAYDTVRSVLHEFTSYSETINVTALPIYYLQPNTRITVNDDDSEIHGDYIVQSISLPLAYNGTMTLQCSKALERI